jgi:hypothetical protein
VLLPLRFLRLVGDLLSPPSELLLMLMFVSTAMFAAILTLLFARGVLFISRVFLPVTVLPSSAFCFKFMAMLLPSVVVCLFVVAVVVAVVFVVVVVVDDDDVAVVAVVAAAAVVVVVVAAVVAAAAAATAVVVVVFRLFVTPST